jgi:hypothetical protein
MTRFPSGGPFLEFNFYWIDIPEEVAFGRLVQALIAHGTGFRRGGLAARRRLGGGWRESAEVQEIDAATLSRRTIAWRTMHTYCAAILSTFERA